MGDGGYWVGRVDGDDALLSDMDLGYDFYKFKYFLAEHDKTGEQGFSYVIKNADKIELVSFSNDAKPELLKTLQDLADNQKILNNKDGINKLLEQSLKQNDISSHVLGGDKFSLSILNHQDTAKFSNTLTNILMLARSFASFSDDGAESAVAGISVVGSAADIASGIVSTPATSVALGTSSSVLAGISALVELGVTASKWSEYSKSAQVAAGFEMGLKAVGSLGLIGSGATGAVLAVKGAASTAASLGTAASALALVISPMQISALMQESDKQAAMQKLGEMMKELGYEGDAMLASLLKDKLIFDSSLTGISTSISLGLAIVQAASAASVVGAPAAALVGLVGGMLVGLIESSR